MSEKKIENPKKKINGPVWEKAKKKSIEEYGKIKWPVVQFLYKKMGG